MTEHLIRGYWLTGGVKFLRTQHTPEANERILGALPRTLRGLLAEIQPAHWYPRTHHVDLLKAVASAQRDEASAYESLLAYGQLVATDSANGPLRSLMPILTPLLLARKLPNLWVSDHQDDGKLETDIARIDAATLSLKLVGLQQYDHVGVATLGWIKGLLLALGHQAVVVKQSGWNLGQASPSELLAEVRWS